MKLKIFGILIGLCVYLCCASPGVKQAKIYRGQLETKIGEKTEDITASFKDWKFELANSWDEENPTADDIKKHNRRIDNFSDSEIQAIFSEEGKYRVMLFTKKEETTDASIGTIDEDGMGYMQDTFMASDRYTLIRAVFKDGVFTHFRVWGNVHQSNISGLKRIR